MNTVLNMNAVHKEYAVTPQTKRGERTTEEILAAAREHLAESGPDGFSLREVARRVGLSPSALYNHFENREALINALAFECVQLLGAYFAPTRAAVTASERLRELGAAYLRFAAEEPVRYRLVFDMLESPVANWDHYVAVAYPFTALVEAVESGLATGEFTDRAGRSASGIAFGMWALVHGSVMLRAHHLAHVSIDLDALCMTAIDDYLAGLHKEQPAEPKKRGTR